MQINSVFKSTLFRQVYEYRMKQYTLPLVVGISTLTIVSLFYLHKNYYDKPDKKEEEEDLEEEKKEDNGEKDKKID